MPDSGVPLSSLPDWLTQATPQGVPLASLQPAPSGPSRLDALLQFLTPEWSKPFAGMSPQQAESEAKILSDPNANPARVGKIGTGYLSDTDRAGMAAADAASWLAPELKGAAALKGVLAATKTLPPIGPELGSGLRAARQMTDLSSNGISAPIVPLRSFELSKYVEPGAAANWNVPKSGFQWRGGEDPGQYRFLTDEHDRTLGGVIADWQWNDATNSGRYIYRPRLALRDPRSNTYSPFGQRENPAAFDRPEEAQQYIEKMLIGGDFSKEAHDRVLAELAPQIEARQRAEAAQAARGQFSVVPPDSQPLLRNVTARGRSGRPIASEPLPIGNENAILERGASRSAPEAALSFEAYHGSPHDFDKFDLSKIGTGEGNKAFGHGLYFAEEPRVAETYRGGRQARPDLTPVQDLADQYLTMSGGRDEAIKEIQKAAKEYGDTPYGREHAEALDLLKSGWSADPAGKMYQVSINADPSHFLDWDKPIHQQPVVLSRLPQEVRDQTLKAGEANKAGWGDFGVGTDPQNYATGQMVVKQLADRLGSHEAATVALRSAGIPGIKYLDQGSRAGGEGTSNYVVFDDKMVDILKKYGLAGLSALPALGAAQSARVPLSSLPPQQ